MRLKLNLIIMSLFLILIINLSFVNSSENSCVVVSQVNCQDVVENGQVVMRLSNVNNAHGSLISESNFPGNWVLCCNFGAGNHDCFEDNIPYDNKILSLSSSENAHAEVPEETSYNNDVCFDGLKDCRSTEESVCSVYEIEVIRLSSNINAHLAAAGSEDYDWRICCEVDTRFEDEPCELTDVMWEEDITHEGLPVEMIVEGEDPCNQNDKINFTIHRRRTLWPDILKISMEGNFPSRIWEAVRFNADQDLDDRTYYFKAQLLDGNNIELESGDLVVKPAIDCSNINLCSDYGIKLDIPNPARTACNVDYCNAASKGGYPYPVRCGWNSDKEKCEAISERPPNCGDGGPIDPGQTCDGVWNYTTVQWESVMFGNFSNLEDEDSCAKMFDILGPAEITGNLICNPPGTEKQCQINTSACTGLPEEENKVCESEGEIYRGQHCTHPDNFGGIITNDCGFFNFDEGELSCYPPGTELSFECLFNTTGCGEGIDLNDPSQNPGKCIWDVEQIEDCDTGQLGFMLFEYKADWIPEIPGAQATEECEDKMVTIECPAYVPLTFFNIYNLIAVIILIALLYLFADFRKKKKNKKINKK